MYFNPLDKKYKNVIGAVRQGEKLKLRVKNSFDSVLFVCHKDGQEDMYFPMDLRGEFFEINLDLDPGLYFYCFKINNDKFISKGVGFEGVITDKPIYFQLTFFSREYISPNWLKGGIIYQIFPDRFNISSDGIIKTDRYIHKDINDIPFFLPDEDGKVKNCDFFGGNIKGIIEKLNYIKSLGVNCIYLNPIFKAFSNHRYDTGDYLTIDPLLGDFEDFDNLIKKAKEFNIEVVLDGVFNHTGDDSIYFDKYSNYGGVGAYINANSIYKNWFDFISYPKEYNSWWGITTLPATNKEEKSDYVDFITKKDGVIDFYTKRNIGGWRLDVVDELPSHFVKKITKSVKKVNPDAIIIGEVWEDASNKVSYGERREYFLGEELDSVMNYPLKNAIIDFVTERDYNSLKKVIYTQIDHYPKECRDNLMNMLSTHDTFRLISALSNINVCGLTKLEQSKIKLNKNEYDLAKKRSKIASLIQYFIYGVPSVYYGDEIGMEGFSDPLNRKFFDEKNKDEELLNWYKKLGEIRRCYSCLIDGETEIIYSNFGGFIFTRKDEFSELLIAVNIGDKNLEFNFDGQLTNLITREVFSNKITLKKFEKGVYIAV